MPHRDTLFLIDGNHLLNRNFHIPEFQNLGVEVDGARVLTGATYGFLNSLRKIYDDHTAPTDETIVIWDSGGHNFRRDIDPEYKSNREARSPEFGDQYDLTKVFVASLGVPQCWEVGEEADDIIGIMATKASAAGWYVIIISADKDFYQLVTDDIHVLRPRMGKIPELLVTPEVVQERFGVPASMFVELKALMGDGSDNISGMKGIGPKTGADLIVANGTIRDIIAADAHFTMKKGMRVPVSTKTQSLINESKAKLANDRALVEIKKVADFTLDIRRTKFDSDLFKALCQQFNFNDFIRDHRHFCELFGWNG